MFDDNLCVICKDSISDPVCKGCYLKQIKILLSDLKIDSMANDVILIKIKNKFPVESLNDTDCVLCKKNKVSICRYCFSVALIKILRELNFTEDLIENFGYNPLYGEDSLEEENNLFEIEKDNFVVEKIVAR